MTISLLLSSFFLLRDLRLLTAKQIPLFFFCTTYQMNNSNYEKAYTTIILALNFVLTSVRDRAL